jgi:hypothetical protein
MDLDRKFEVNCDYNDPKPRQALYRDLSHSGDLSLEQRSIELI